MGTRSTTDVGLVGGSIEQRLEHSRVPPVESPHVLAPFRREGDEARARALAAAGGLHIEIGFGRAHHLAALAQLRADEPVIGFEVRRQWCRVAAKRAARLGLHNLTVIEGDARPYLQRLVPEGSVKAFYVLFPDPWWKKRHHKRRLITPETVELLWRLLEPQGMLVAKTDVPAYADLVEECLDMHGGFRLAGTSVDDPVLAELPRSHREKKCLELGIPTSSFRYIKESAT